MSARACVWGPERMPTHCDSLCSLYRLKYFNTLLQWRILHSSRYYTKHIIQLQILHKAYYTAPDTTKSTLYNSRYYTKHIIQLQILQKAHYTTPDTTQSTLYSSRYYTKHIIQLQILHKARYTAPDTTQSTFHAAYLKLPLRCGGGFSSTGIRRYMAALSVLDVLKKGNAFISRGPKRWVSISKYLNLVFKAE
jgi:hypothetical protein